MKQKSFYRPWECHFWEIKYIQSKNLSGRRGSKLFRFIREKEGVAEHVEVARYFARSGEGRVAMALVSAGGMGEAVLSYGAGDGITSEVVNQAKDGGGVFGALQGDGLGGILVGGGRQKEDEEGRRGCVRVLVAEQEALVQQTCNRRLVNVRVQSDIISKAARLATGDISCQVALETGGKTADGVAERGEDGEGESNASDAESLVEMAIQCLDEKVTYVHGYSNYSSKCWESGAWCRLAGSV